MPELYLFYKEMHPNTYKTIKKNLIDRGYQQEMDMILDMLDTPCDDKRRFLLETIYVIINSGMKQQIAKKIYEKVVKRLESGKSIEGAFRHKGKVKAILYVWENYDRLWSEYITASDKLSYLESIPFVGPITKYHLARNLGMDTVKPDRHLERISKKWGTDPFTLCERISKKTGDKVGFVDFVIWRAANLGWV